MAASLTVAVPAAADPSPIQSPTSMPAPVADPLGGFKQEARKQNKRIEIPAYRSETSTIYANPDGKTLRLEMNTTPIRVKRDGSWQPVDTTLVVRDGAVRPRMTTSDLALSDGGDTTLLTAQRTGKSALPQSHGKETRTTLSVPRSLPAPKLSGNRAEYSSAYGPGIDLVVTATPTGFRQQIVIRQRPEKPLTFRIPLDPPKGFSLSTTGGKTALFRDGGKGKKKIADISLRLMLDAVAARPDSGPDEGRVGRAKTTVQATSGQPTLVLAPDPAFLADPAVSYPVTLAAADSDWWEPEEDYTVDTFVNDAGFPTSIDNQWLDRILVGNSNSGTVRWRSYLRFEDIPADSLLRGGTVTNADLVLWNHLSNDCGETIGSGITARRITSDWSPDTLTWDDQPSVTSASANTEYGAYSPNCTSASWAAKEWDLIHSVNGIVQAWADGEPNYGFRLTAGSESDSTNWRRYRSTEYETCRNGTACQERPHQPLLFVDFEPRMVTTARGFYVPGPTEGTGQPTDEEVAGHYVDRADNPTIPALDGDQARELREDAKSTFIQDADFGFYPPEEITREEWLAELDLEDETAEVETDTTPPIVVSTDPVANATGVALSTTVGATFDEPIATPTFVLKDAAGAAVAGSLTAKGFSLSFVPGQPLASNMTYTAEVSAAIDVDGNIQAGLHSWTFTTGHTAPPVNGLVAAYGMNDGAGVSVADASGKGNDGTGRDTSWTAGKYGQGLAFNGSSSWVTVPDSATLRLETGMTLSAWVKPENLSGWRTVVMKELTQSEGASYALYASNGEGPSGWLETSNGVGTVGGSPLPIGTWSHVAVTYDGAVARLYVNGAPAAESPVLGPLTDDGGSLRIGGNDVWGEFFQGTIDEVRVYNLEQTPEQIQADMNAPVGDAAPGATSISTGPVAVYGMNDGGGLSVADAFGASSEEANPVVVQAVQAAGNEFPYDRVDQPKCQGTRPEQYPLWRLIKNSFNVCYTGIIGEDLLVNNVPAGRWSARISIVVHTYVGHQGNTAARGLAGTDSRQIKAWIRVDSFKPGIWGAAAATRPFSVHVNNTSTCTSDKPNGILDAANQWTVGADRVITLTSPKADFSAPNHFGYCGIQPSIHYPETDDPQRRVGLLDDERVEFRCDSSPDITNFTGGCVVWSTRPTWLFNGNDAESEQTAAHIWKALNDPQNTDPKFPGQTKNIPGKINPADRGCRSGTGCLTRSMSKRKVPGSVANRNWRAARRECKKLSKTGFTEPSCDEFPFASTHEGSAFAGINFSVAIVEKSDNCSGGAKLGNWYLYNRVLEKDPFWVYVVKKGQAPPPEAILSDVRVPVTECDS